MPVNYPQKAIDHFSRGFGAHMANWKLFRRKPNLVLMNIDTPSVKVSIDLSFDEAKRLSDALLEAIAIKDDDMVQAKMTRTEFVRQYAKRSGGLYDGFANLGIIEIDLNRTLIALPCGCAQEECEGWAMLGPNEILSHLMFNTPEPLRNAYRAAIDAAETFKETKS